MKTAPSSCYYIVTCHLSANTLHIKEKNAVFACGIVLYLLSLSTNVNKDITTPQTPLMTSKTTAPLNYGLLSML